jgi:glycine dehydrogenase subunit 1
MSERRSAHPYIPNSIPEVKREMLREIGVKDAEELYAEMIPERLRLKRRMQLPEPLPAEHSLKMHVEKILSRNKTCDEYLSFLGAGCWQHYVPAVCDEITGRSEFLTVYDGEWYSSLGRLQTFFEFQSMMGELLEMDVVGVPTYDWGASAGNAIHMAARITGRNEVLVARTAGPSRLSIVRNFCQPTTMPSHIDIRLIEYQPESGLLDLDDLKTAISSKTAAVYFENPSYLGTLESQGQAISEIAHEKGAVSIVGVDPISLGVLAPPAHYGADIVCGEAQPLGIHMHCGGGLCGFLACRDDEKYVGELPSLLISITDSVREGEYAFGQCAYERTSYASRERAKDWVGTTTALWAVAAAVYMALMGPNGMKEIGESIIQRSHYAAKMLSELEGIRVPFLSFFKEFVVDFKRTDKRVSDINNALLSHGIFGGKDISREFPELEESALYSVTEIHTLEDIERLVDALKDVLT